MTAPSELALLTKSRVSQLARHLGIYISVKDTKQKILEKLEAHLEKSSNPARDIDAAFATIDGSTPTKAADVTVDNAAYDLEDSAEPSPSNTNSAASSAATILNLLFISKDDDPEDADYLGGPPLDVKLLVVDPLLQRYEAAKSSILELTDSVGITYVDYCHELRERLSTLVFLNYLELSVEFAFFLYAFLSPVPFNENPLNTHFFKQAWPSLATSELRSLDISGWVSFEGISTALVWLMTAIVMPLVASYFVNFSKRVLELDDGMVLPTRVYTYDPFVFALCKVVIVYFLHKLSGTSVPVNVDAGWILAAQNYANILVHLYYAFLARLGSAPVVLGLANVAIALYSQFEEY